MERRLLRARLPRMFALTAACLIVGGGVAQASTPPPEFACLKGEFCAWTDEFYGGKITRLDLRTANPEECVPLPADFDGRAFANRLDRLITVYQGRDCSTEGDFTTYPGGGTFVPQAPFVARAIQIWE
ncbi:peptidase inhibitor family I36 protein [Amycolatopsis sp. NPDC059657]|uniref:peptidase inhibitor family I36 protein n=1 Tax=Amycolatopsis sp. NPDC059657 TaxID=3346899 RepID=UPI003671CD58